MNPTSVQILQLSNFSYTLYQIVKMDNVDDIDEDSLTISSPPLLQMIRENADLKRLLQNNTTLQKSIADLLAAEIRFVQQQHHRSHSRNHHPHHRSSFFNQQQQQPISPLERRLIEGVSSEEQDALRILVDLINQYRQHQQQ